jgi:hypothetical protein
MSTAQRREEFPAEVADLSVDELLSALSESKILNTLDISNEDLHLAHSDSDLLETLRITYEIHAALLDFNVLETFFRLPKADQADFLRWIGMTDDRDLRRNRIEAFVSALEESPLAGIATLHDTPQPRT